MQQDILDTYAALEASTTTTVNGLAVIHQGFAMRLIRDPDVAPHVRWEAYADIDGPSGIEIASGTGATPLEAMDACVEAACLMDPSDDD